MSIAPSAESAAGAPRAPATRLAATAAPLLAGLATAAGFLLPIQPGTSPPVPRVGPAWVMLGLGAAMALATAWGVHRLFGARLRPSDVVRVLGLAMVPWLAGIVLGLNAGPEREQGAFLSWGLLLGAGVGLALASWVRRPGLGRARDLLPIAAATLPLVAVALLFLRTPNLGVVTLGVLATSVLAALLMVVAGVAVTRGQPSPEAAMATAGAGVGLGLAVWAAATVLRSRAIREMLLAFLPQGFDSPVGATLIPRELAGLTASTYWVSGFAMLGAVVLFRVAARATASLNVLPALAVPLVPMVAGALALDGIADRIAGGPRAREAAMAARMSEISIPAPPESPPAAQAPLELPPYVPDTGVGPGGGYDTLGVPGGVVGGASGGFPDSLTGVAGDPNAPYYPPEVLSRVTPEYPAVARSAGVEGTVLLEVAIDAGGFVTQVSSLAGPPLLVQAAISAVYQWRYRPARRGGQPVPAPRHLEQVTFRLSP